MEEKLLKVLPTCTRPNFGLQIKLDPQYDRAYVLDVDAKSSAAKLFSSLPATQQAISLSYIVEIVGHCIFSKSEATTALGQIRDEGVSELHITFAIESALTKKQQRHNANELTLFDPRIKWKGNELPTNDLNCVNTDFSSSNCITVTDDRAESQLHLDTVNLSPFQDMEDIDFENICDDDAPDLDIFSLCAIAALQSGLDFSKESISTDIILTVINSITFQAIIPAEQALGKSTRRKLKNMDTWNDRDAGKRKQLNQFHDLQMFGKDMARPLDENSVILQSQWQYHVKKDGQQRAQQCCN